MPKWINPLLIVLAALSLVPFALVARARVTRTDEPRLHLVQDMDNQARFKSQQANPWFADGRAMRPPLAGTIARGALPADEAHAHGISGAGYLKGFPPQVALTRETIARGRARFDIYCAPCHGLSGYGDGVVARRADRLQQGTWIPPASLHVEPALSRPEGHLFNTITNGIRTMPPYGNQIRELDRWAIVAYVKALQKSTGVAPAELPADVQAELKNR